MGSPMDIVKTAINPFVNPGKTLKQGLDALGLGAPEMPTLPGAPPVAPVPDTIEAKKRAIIDLQRKYATAGRAGTVLSQNSKLG